MIGRTDRGIGGWRATATRKLPFRRHGAEWWVVRGLWALGFGLLLVMALCPQIVPVASLLVPLTLANLGLGPDRLRRFALLAIVLLVGAMLLQTTTSYRTIASAVMVLLSAVVTLMVSRRRERLGVAGLRGESMLVDLRDKIQRTSRIPDLPAEWYADAVVDSAEGTPFAGDFLVSMRSPDRTGLSVALVDVSGKGNRAGTRSLLLSGAFGGLLGAMEHREFLAGANEYVLRQDWDEGFATAVHLALDLSSGEYELRAAGHPPALHLHAGSGRWQVEQAEGPALGLLPAAEYPALRGRLAPGDVLIVYSDGLVERRDCDLSLGIDRLAGQAERCLLDGVEGAVQRIVEAIRSEGGVPDDRAMALIHRRPYDGSRGRG